MKTLFDEVVAWEKIRGVNFGDDYNPSFDRAIRIASRTGFKFGIGTTVSHFDRTLSDDECLETLIRLDHAHVPNAETILTFTRCRDCGKEFLTACEPGKVDDIKTNGTHCANCSGPANGI